MATTVRRRLVYIKRTKNPHAPLPRRRPSASDEMVGEKAKPFAPFAVPTPRPAAAKQAGWMRFAKPAAVFAGVICVGVAIAAMGKASTSSYSNYAEPEVRPFVSHPSSSRTTISHGSHASSLPAVLAQRTAPTDTSFRASSYVRQKVSLPDISGDCTVARGGGADVAGCLQRAAAAQ